MARTRYMNATQAAIALGKNEKTVRRWISEGKLKAERPTPRSLAIPLSEIDRVKKELEQLEQFTPEQGAGSLAALDTDALLERVAQLERKVSELAREPLEPTNATRPSDTTINKETRQKATTERPASIAGIPDDALPIAAFAERYGVKPRTFRDHFTIGIRGERITDVIERPKPSRPNETERFLTPEQGTGVLDYWTRHNVSYHVPEISEPEQEV